MIRPLLAPALLASALLTGAAPAAAQSDVDARVARLERELRAVQRQVFPNAGRGDAPQVLQPEIVPQAPGTTAPGNQANTALANLTSRVAALEAQLAELTGQGEQAQYRLRQLEQRVEQMAQDLARRPEPAPVTPPVLGTPAPAAGGGARPAAPAAAADPARAERVAAVQRPSTGDAAEDGYVYGFRLWQAQLYPEAQAALKAVADANPNHRRYSWAQNLLGRAYLDDGKPALAAIAFLDNYEKKRDGERAADSLYYLGMSLIAQNKRADACRVFGEFTDVYGTTARPELIAQVAAGRTEARCRS
ncbi:TolA-binding protein [Sphingomonas jejuensis]|uniref:TolA-binding protein n=1 Tax=Sphingomonas jejuensis TaxID=904715 RepID=A0ABX0XPM0_9SPHN|nr:YbgF trimerization domain-containing protein [Sphingomonas jejuensis]NJC35168.1 TolA-binding protein [Sphingomonas jejuensis]